MTDTSKLIFTSIKTMVLPPYAFFPGDSPAPVGFYAPLGWYLYANNPSIPPGAAPLAPGGANINRILFDPSNHFPDFVEGTVIEQTPFVTYKATATQVAAHITVRFDSATAGPNTTINRSDNPLSLTGYDYRWFPIPNEGLIYPAGTATGDGEYTFFPSNSWTPAPAPPAGYPPGAAPPTIYALAYVYLSTNGDPSWSPPDAMPADIYCQAGKYLAGHIGFPPSSAYLASQTLNGFGLTALYVVRAAAPPYVTELDGQSDFPSCGVRAHVGTGGGGPGNGGSAGLPDGGDAAQDTATGRVVKVTDGGGGGGAMTVCAWEGFQNLSGVRPRLPAPLLDSAQAPVIGRYPSLWILSEEGTYFVCYQDAQGQIVLAKSNDGLATLMPFPTTVFRNANGSPKLGGRPGAIQDGSTGLAYIAAAFTLTDLSGVPTGYEDVLIARVDGSGAVLLWADGTPQKIILSATASAGRPSLILNRYDPAQPLLLLHGNREFLGTLGGERWQELFP